MTPAQTELAMCKSRIQDLSEHDQISVQLAAHAIRNTVSHYGDLGVIAALLVIAEVQANRS